MNVNSRVIKQLLWAVMATVSLWPDRVAAQSAQPPVAVPPQPVASGAAADYRVGPSDVLSIAVYRSPELAVVTTVSPDGTIVIPTIDRVPVGNKTVAEISSLIEQRLKAAGILIAPSVTTIVSQVRSRVAMVMGAVNRPGEIPLSRPGMTYSAVLAMAGAVFTSGDGMVTVLRGDTPSAPREQVAVADIVSGAADREVRPGDTLIVQAASVMYVSGEVGKPGSYAIQPGMTVGQAIAVGGGITPRGSARRLQITRTGPDRKTFTVPDVSFDTPVQPNDLISVKTRIF